MAETESKPEGLWKHYWATWRTMFAIQSMALVLGLSIAIPVIALATSQALGSSGNTRINDIDLLDLLTGPSFPLVIIAIASLWIIVHVFGYAAQLYAAHASFHGADISVFTAIRKTGRAFLPLIQLAFLFFLQIVIVSLPFLLVIVGVLAIQLREEGLSYYLTYGPPEFIFAVALSLTVFAVMVLVLLQITVRWVHALPLVLFHGEPPRSAKRISRKNSRIKSRRTFFSFALWALGTPLLIIILNSAWLPLALWASKALGHRLGLLALLLSLLILITFAIATLVGFIHLTLLAIQHVRIYRQADLDHDEPPVPPEALVSPGIRLGIVTALTLIGLLTIGFSYRWLDGLRIADKASVIALRGASSDAPENTLAAISRAFDQGASDVALDVQALSNNTLVVFADSDFTRIAGNPLKLRDATEEDLATIDIGSWKHPKYDEERVPRLDALIGLLADPSGLMLLLPDIPDETDRAAFFTKLVDLIEWTKISPRTRLVCARAEHVPEIHALRPDWKVGFKSPYLIDRPIKVPVDFVIVPAATLRSSLIRNLHRHGIEVIAADTKDPVIMSAVLSRGADGLLVTAPGIGHKVLEERASLNPGERLLIEFITRIRDALPSRGTQVNVPK